MAFAANGGLRTHQYTYAYIRPISSQTGTFFLLGGGRGGTWDLRRNAKSFFLTLLPHHKQAKTARKQNKTCRDKTYTAGCKINKQHKHTHTNTRKRTAVTARRNEPGEPRRCLQSRRAGKGRASRRRYRSCGKRIRAAGRCAPAVVVVVVAGVRVEAGGVRYEKQGRQ